MRVSMIANATFLLFTQVLVQQQGGGVAALPTNVLSTDPTVGETVDSETLVPRGLGNLFKFKSGSKSKGSSSETDPNIPPDSDEFTDRIHRERTYNSAQYGGQQQQQSVDSHWSPSSYPATHHPYDSYQKEIHENPYYQHESSSSSSSSSESGIRSDYFEQNPAQAALAQGRLHRGGRKDSFLGRYDNVPIGQEPEASALRNVEKPKKNKRVQWRMDVKPE